MKGKLINAAVLLLFTAGRSLLPAQSYSAHVINVSGGETGNIILVEKASQNLMVQKSFGPEQLVTVKDFKITTGRVQGDKANEGDMKTPEGIYYVQFEIPGEKLDPKYGPLAMVLDYPNALDKLNNRNGSNIWIHGRDVEIRDLMTEGCISLDNESTLVLETYIEHRITPVIIVDSLQYINADELSKQHRYWKNRIEEWRRYWETGDIEHYLKQYSEDFRDQNGRNRTAYGDYKSLLEKKYAWKTITLSDIVVYRTPEEIHAHFNQRYESPVFKGNGSKILVFKFDVDGEWRILEELYRETEPRKYAQTDLTDFVRRWQVAWENQDMAKYEKFYSPNYDDGENTFIPYMDYKKSKFAEGKVIRIRTGEMKIRNSGEHLWEVSFIQEYKAGDYEDRGTKVLNIREVNGVYFIISERWTAL